MSDATPAKARRLMDQVQGHLAAAMRDMQKVEKAVAAPAVPANERERVADLLELLADGRAVYYHEDAPGSETIKTEVQTLRAAAKCLREPESAWTFLPSHLLDGWLAATGSGPST